MTMTNLREFNALGDSTDISYILYVGPGIIVRSDPLFADYMNPKHDATLLISKIHQFYTLTDMPYSRLKDIINREIVNNIRLSNSQFQDDKYRKLYLGFLDDLMKSTRKYQYENKLLESAMIDCCPIVPYTTEIKLPPFGQKLNDIPYEDALLSLLVTIPFEIFEYAKKHPNYEASDAYKDTIHNVVYGDGKRHINAETYFTIAWYFYNKSTNLGEFKGIDKLINAVTSDLSVEKQVEGLESAISDTDITNFENGTFNNALRAEYEKIKPSPISDDPASIKQYNLDKLTSFIYNARRYKTLEYINSLFASTIKNPTNVTYLNDNLTVYEVDEKLIVPVQDLANNYEIRLIVMDKDCNITVEKFTPQE